MADPGLINLWMTRFEPVLRMTLQQKQSILRSAVDESTITGAKMASPLNLIGPMRVKEKLGRFQPKQNTVAIYSRRWVVPTDYADDAYIDEFDLQKTTIDPRSPIVQSFAASFGREVDDAIIQAATGAATVGADAGSLTTESFTVAGSQPNTTSTFQVLGSFGGSATTGLTVAKINEGRRLLTAYHNGEELRSGGGVLVIGSQQEADLRNQVLVTSSEFNPGNMVMKDGRIESFMGFRIIVSERLPIITDAAGNTTMRGCLMFVRSGIHLGIWQDLKTQVFQRPDLNGNPWDVSVTASYGATRTENGKVIQICAYDPTPAVDVTS
jgi:hypothetical protein